MVHSLRNLLGLLVVLLACAAVPAADAPPAPVKSALISAEQAESWPEMPDTHGAERLWHYKKPEYRATVLLTQTEIGSNKLSAVIDKVLDQLDKQFGLKPEKSEQQFAAANCMGYKVVYTATGHAALRYQVQYFIPKGDMLYILTCSCKKGCELGIDFDAFAASFVPPPKK